MIQPVYTLLCKRDLEMALITLPRIVQFLSPEQEFIVVDDGSFDKVTTDRVREISTQIKVIVREEREEIIVSQLANYPNCRKYRNEYGPAFKLLDIPLLAKETHTRFCYTDSDIIYIKNCEDYFNRNENTYLRTDAIKLSVKLSKALFKYKWAIPYKFNSGYFSFDCKDYDLDLIEYFVSRDDVRNISWVTEQTGWALQFGQSGAAYCPNEEQFVCREHFDGPTTETLAIHLIANLKGKVQEWSKQNDNKSEAIKPNFEKSRNVSLSDWVQKSVKRFIRY